MSRRLDPSQTANQAPYVAGTLWQVDGEPFWIDPRGQAVRLTDGEAMPIGWWNLPRDFVVRPLQLVELVEQVAP